MKPRVNSRRSYDATRRLEQARETRRTVLAVATEMFLADGYAATRVASIAERAGVSVETIYKTIGKKPALAKACFDVAIVGDDEPIPLIERDLVAQGMALSDPREKLRRFAEHQVTLAPRVGPIQLVIKAAAASDASAAEVWDSVVAERLVGMQHFAQHLRDTKALRRGVGVDEARDVLWTYIAPELWDLLVHQRGWTNERYATWVGQQLVAALL